MKKLMKKVISLLALLSMFSICGIASTQKVRHRRARRIVTAPGGSLSAMAVALPRKGAAIGAGGAGTYVHSRRGHRRRGHR